MQAHTDLNGKFPDVETLLTSLPLGIGILIGEDMIVTVANPALQKTWGHSDIIGKSVYEVIPELKEQGFDKLLNYVYKTGETYFGHEAKMSFQRANSQEELFCNFYYQAFKGEDGKIKGVTIISNEITNYVLSKKAIEYKLNEALVKEQASKKEIELEREKMFSLFMKAPASITIRNKHNVFEFVNDEYLRMINKKRHEVIGKTSVEIWPELKSQMIDEELIHVLRGKTINFTDKSYVFDTGNGLEKRYYNYTRQPMYSSVGEITGSITFGIDVTAQVVARKTVEESVTELAELADSMPQMVWAAHPDGKIYYFNKQWINYTGMSMTELAYNWGTILHQDDVAMTQTAWERSLQTGEPVNLKYRLKNITTKEYRWFLARAVPVRDKEGVILRWLGTCTDIQEQHVLEEVLRESETRFRALAGISREFIFMTDERAVLLYANTTLLDYMGLKEIAQLNGKEWETFIHPEDIERLHQSFALAMSKKKSCKVKCRFKNNSGEYSRVLFLAAPRYTANDVVGIIGNGVIAEDIQNLAQEFSDEKDGVTPIN